ncbi:Rossmann-like and DUF2520 domain-containing protein [Brachybacterium aquaticum]|uniref:Putative short-subunit dehydrogenase-like oxidoreductase (DUF2520 family) n=1 Tax=Brachybacterium aquaticum TaxID=1432564 RepID=A0A841AA78_9MICO|nr:DUF2520 domain-containing protein [Brachybacterium aquaticum]MBB5831746.1 putative short-subunit dehydrogenase-like oxidoreductase (DUF2520 family) [Brachybacterium aquaticum]
MNPPRLGIGVIGAGRVGAVLGAALRAEGHAITGAYAVSDASRERAEALLPGVPLLDVPAIVERSEMLLLAVPDDQLAPLAAGIAATGLVPGGQLVAHTSGRYGAEVLAPLARAGSATLAIHPAMTFTGTRTDLSRLVGCPMGITAAEEFLPVAAALVVEMGGEAVVIAEGDRPLYHAALAHAANHLVVLVDQSRQALARLGIENPGEYLRPLLEAALDESLRRGSGALTGPVVRGDAGTVAAHLTALADLDATAAPVELGDVGGTYRALAAAALARARLPEDARTRIRELLEENPPREDA